MPAFTSIATGLGLASTAGGVLSNLFDGGDDSTGDAYTQAAQIQAQAAREAAAQQERFYQQARADVAPWRETGGAAATQKAGLWGLPGYTALDPTATLKATPGYDWLRTQGLEALDRSGLARGMNLSGAQTKGITDYGQNLALTKAWQPYVAGLTDMSNSGLQAGGMSGNWAMNTGQQQGGYTMAGGQATASGLVNSANANLAADQTANRNLMQSLGMMGGLAGGLSNMWNSGGSGSNYSFTTPTMPNLTGYGSSAYPGFQMPNLNTGYMQGLGMYADGGLVPDTKPIIVGERGPEVFVPDRPGYVVPNYALPFVQDKYRWYQ